MIGGRYEMSFLINLLSSNGYIILNKDIMKKLGLHEAIILGELCSEYNYWDKANKLDDGYFYSTRDNIEVNTGLSAYQQREPFKKLIDMGIVLEKMKGIPQQKWYSLDMNKLCELLNAPDLMSGSKETKEHGVKKLEDKALRNLTPSCKETAYHDVEKLNTNNNNNNNNNSNNKDYRKKIKYKDMVYLFSEEYSDLINRFGNERIERMIKRLDLHKKSTGKKYVDDYSTILLWIDIDMAKEKEGLSNQFKSQDEIWLADLKSKYGEHLDGLYAN